MNYKQVFCTSVACLALSVSGYAQTTVQVNSTLPPQAGVRYQTITAALDYVALEEEPRTINITGGGPYLENIVAQYSVTVRGHNYRPVVVTPPTSGMINSLLNDAGVVFFSVPAYPGNQSFRLENLVIIPDAANPPTYGVRANNNALPNLSAVDLNIELDNVLIAANNGSNAPVSEDGLIQADMTGAVPFKDDIVRVQGFTNVTMTNTILTHQFGTGATTTDGVLFWSDAPGYKLTIGPGCIISYMNQRAVQMVAAGLMMEVIGTEDNPVIFKSNVMGPTSNPAITVFLGDAGQTENFKIENAVFLENKAPAFTQSAFTGGTARGADFNNVAFVNNEGPALELLAPMNKQVTLTNVTIVGNGSGAGTAASAVRLENLASVGTVRFVDSIIAGRGAVGTGTDPNNVVNITATQMNVIFQNSALVTEGPHELAGNGYRLDTGVSAPTFTSVINADPDFVEVGADFEDDAFLAVSNTAYATAGTGGDPLTGYGLYMPNASVGGWMLY